MLGQLGTKKFATTAYSSPKQHKSMHFSTKTASGMRPFFIFLLVASLQVPGRGLAQTVSFTGQNVPLVNVFDSVKKQTGYVFFYDADLLKTAKPVTIKAVNVALEKFLSDVLANQSFRFSIKNKNIIIFRKLNADGSGPGASGDVTPARFTVSGFVANELGDPMTRVSIRQKGTLRFTITDDKGIYVLPVTDDKALVEFTYVGYEPQELSARDIPPGSVVILKPAPQSIQEVVINKGYYSEKRALSTGDVAVVTSKEIEEQPVTDPVQALIGRVAGLNIQQTSGIPGSYAAINIRGINSLTNGNDPFYVVDGVPFNSSSLSSNYMTGGALGYNLGSFSGSNSAGDYGGGNGLSPFNVLNPADIESIEILKDADATAIYGSRGANGVILITTKKGRAGDTRVNLDVSQGVSQVGHFMNLLNTKQYLQMMHQAFTNDGLPFPNINTNPYDTHYDIDGVWDTTRYTNWQKVLIGGAAQYTNAQASVSGGTANTQFLVSAGYTRSTTVYPGDYGDQKASLHFSVNHASTNQKFHLQLTGLYGYENNKVPNADFAASVNLAPDAPALYNSDGTLNWQMYSGTATFQNPVAATAANITQAVNNVNANLNLSYLLLPGLVLKTSFGYNRGENNEVSIMPNSVEGPPNNTNPNASINNNAISFNSSWIIEPQLGYDRKMGKGQLNVVLGGTYQQQNSSSQAFNAYGFTSNALISDAQAAAYFQPLGFGASVDRYAAILARVGYNFDGKYILNLTANRDGSSRFGPGRQFGNFGAVGAGWIFSKENAVVGALPWLSFGKLRASYGTTGNYQIGYYQYLAMYGPSSNTYQGLVALDPGNLYNPDYSWETDKKLEGGLDLGFLRDRINLSVSYYRNRSGNQLISYTLPAITGFTSVIQNFPALVQNTGTEITLHTVNIKSKNFSWSTSVNFTDPKNKLISFPGIAQTPYADQYDVGQSLFARKLFQYTGVDPKTGLYTFKTANSNGIPSAPQDQIWTKPVTQNFYGGIGNDFTYKDFSLDIFLQVVNQSRVGYQVGFQTPGTENANQPTAVLGAWNAPGQVASVQGYSTSFLALAHYYIFLLSTGDVAPVFFVKMTNAALSYHLPAAWQRRMHMQNARIFVQGQNLCTFAHHYVGFDPTTSAGGLPPLRTITGGLSVSF